MRDRCAQYSRELHLMDTSLEFDEECGERHMSFHETETKVPDRRDGTAVISCWTRIGSRFRIYFFLIMLQEAVCCAP